MAVRAYALVFAASAGLLGGCGPSGEVARLQQQAETLKGQLSSVVAQRDQAQQKLIELQAKVEELSATPGVLLARVDEPVKAGNLPAAEKALAVLTQRFPSSAEAGTAQKRVAGLRAKLEQQAEEARQLAALGFKALKVSPAVNLGDVAVTFGVPRLNRQFVFDRYDSRYFYRNADRDHKYVLTGMKATAAKGATDPDLPGLALYWADGKVLRKLDNFKMEFARWEDYGTYLGNYHDFSNDFAKTATISFELAVEGADAELARRPLYVVATKTGCQTRGHERLRNPPVYYFGLCSDLASTLPLEAFAGESKVALVRRLD